MLASSSPNSSSRSCHCSRACASAPACAGLPGQESASSAASNRSHQRRGETVPSPRRLVARRNCASRARLAPFSSRGASCSSPRSSRSVRLATPRCWMSSASAARCAGSGRAHCGAVSHVRTASRSNASPASSARLRRACAASGCSANGGPPSRLTCARPSAGGRRACAGSSAARTRVARRSRTPAPPGSMTSRRASGCAARRPRHQAAMASSSACVSCGRRSAGAAGASAGASGAGPPLSAARRGLMASKPRSSTAAGASASPGGTRAASAPTSAAFSSRQRAWKRRRASYSSAASVPAGALASGMR